MQNVGRAEAARPTTDLVGWVDQLIDWAAVSSFDEAFVPSSDTAAMQTTAIRATSSAYSTSEAPRSSSMRARSQLATNSNEVNIGWLCSLGK